MAKLGLFQKIKLVNSISKAFDEVKEIIDANAGNVAEAKEIVEDAKALFEKVKNFAPQLGSAIQGIVNVVKNLKK